MAPVIAYHFTAKSNPANRREQMNEQTKAMDYEAGFQARLDGILGAPQNASTEWQRGFDAAAVVREQWEDACQEHWDRAA